MHVFQQELEDIFTIIFCFTCCRFFVSAIADFLFIICYSTFRDVTVNKKGDIWTCNLWLLFCNLKSGLFLSWIWMMNLGCYVKPH